MIEINNQDNIAENNIIEKRNADEKNEDEYRFFRMITEKSLFNEKRTKIISKDNYDSLIKIINEENPIEFIYFLNYLNKVGIQILKVLINGFIEFDNGKNQEKIISGDGKTIGGNVRRLRESRRIGQTEMVAKLQLRQVPITRETLVKIEGGRQHIKLAQLRGIRDVLGVSYEDILDN